MKKLSTKEIDKIARLARIDLSSAEATGLCSQLGQIIGFVEQLQSVDTSSVVETSQVTGLVDVWREDEVRRCPIDREKLLAAAPQQKDGYIVVKRVMR